jgi:hypothetical protein
VSWLLYCSYRHKNSHEFYWLFLFQYFPYNWASRIFYLLNIFNVHFNIKIYKNWKHQYYLAWHIKMKLCYIHMKNNEVRAYGYFFFSFFIFCSFIHMCIHCLGHFSTLYPSPTLQPQPPQFQAGSFLSLSLILLKKDISIIRNTRRFC